MTFAHQKLMGTLLAIMVALVGGNSVAADWQNSSKDAVGKGASYLIKVQNDDGSWGVHKHPAIAALAVMAIHGTPNVDEVKAKAAVEKGMKYILSYVQPDGSIFPSEIHRKNQKKSAFYPNYSTSIILLCMASINRPQDKSLMIKARKYLMSTQFTDPDAVDYGGIGYGKTRRADLSNGSWATEALYYTEYLDEEPHSKDPQAKKRVSKMWAAMAEFVTKCQNLDTNKQNYVSDHPADKGGFFYRPNESKAGTYEGKDGVSKLVSSGSMSYMGLKTMMYARLKKDDPRVKGALEYLMRNYRLDENPGMGMQGHYHYLLIMSKALNAYGEDVLTDSYGRKREWRKDVTQEFLKMQNADGSWTNNNGRFFESDPTLATPYAVIALRVATKIDPLKKK